MDFTLVGSNCFRLSIATYTRVAANSDCLLAYSGKVARIEDQETQSGLASLLGQAGIGAIPLLKHNLNQKNIKIIFNKKVFKMIIKFNEFNDILQCRICVVGMDALSN